MNNILLLPTLSHTLLIALCFSCQRLFFALFITLFIIISHLHCELSCSVVSDSATSWTVTCQAPLSMGILQARILEWVAFPFSRRSSQPRDRTQVFHIAGRFFTSWATRGKFKNTGVGSLARLQGVFLTQELNHSLLHCRWILYQLSYQGSPSNNGLISKIHK